MMTEQVPRAFMRSRRLLEATPPHPFGRPLLCTALIFVSAYASWLGGLGPFGRPPLERCAEVQAVLPMLIYSLSVAEDDPDPRGAWPLRSKQEHAGCVALSKMCPPRSGAAAAPLAVAPLPELRGALLDAVGARPRPISQRSACLLLGAASQLARARMEFARRRGRRPDGGGAPSALPAVAPAARCGGGGGGGGGAARRPRGAPELFRSAPPSLCAAHAAALGADGASSLGACVLPLPAAAAGVGAAACAALAALLTAAARRRRRCSPPSFRRYSAASRRRCCPRPSCATPSPSSAPRSSASRLLRRRPDADAQLGALVAHVGGALATGGRSDDAAAHAAAGAAGGVVRAVRRGGRRGGLRSARGDARDGRRAAAPKVRYDKRRRRRARRRRRRRGDGGRRRRDAVAARLLGAALRSPPPPDLYDDADGVIGLKTALVMLAQPGRRTRRPPAPRCGPLGDALWRADAPAAAAAAGGGGESAGGLVLRELLGLSMMPSWLIGEAAAACWELHRHHGDHFARWLREAMAADGVPRRGLSAEQKAAFCEQLVGAANRTAQAALKHVSGGKKKERGSPAR